jgi:hypothetical protein
MKLDLLLRINYKRIVRTTHRAECKGDMPCQLASRLSDGLTRPSAHSSGEVAAAPKWVTTILDLLLNESRLLDNSPRCVAQCKGVHFWLSPAVLTGTAAAAAPLPPPRR